MKVSIFRTNHNSESFYKKWVEILHEMDFNCDEVGICDKNSYKELTSSNGIMCHFFHNPDEKRIANQWLTTFEKVHKMPVFPNFETRWHFDDKISQFYLLREAAAPVVNSWIFNDKETAQHFVKSAAFPLVFKLSAGAGSANVLLIEDSRKAEELIDIMFGDGIYPYSKNEFSKSERNFIHRAYDSARYTFSKKKNYICRIDPYQYQLHKNYCYFQEFLPGNEFDIRITVIGNRAFAFTRRNRPNDFRASGSGLIEYNLDRIPLEVVKIAHKVSEQCGFQSMAYDFLFDPKGKPSIIEISYGYQSKAVFDCPGFWDRELNWHTGHVLPEKAHVDDFIYYIRNKKLR